MLPQFNNTIQLGWNLYITDFLDIAIIAVLIYSLIIFFKRTKGSMVFAGIAIAGGLYVIADLFNLYLTSITLRYFAGVSIIIVVVLFQNEIRRYFEFLGLIGTRQIKTGALNTESPSLEGIIQSCVQMAQDKIGALIVIEGKQNIESLVEGGVALDGVISEEVILSIFDPSSHGHDGAMIVRNNRISKFGVHLPLSTNFKALGKHGLRHSAGLGLSENCDAFCIVVSEERKQISICMDGKIKALPKFDNLEKELTKYISNTFTIEKEKGINKVLKHNATLKFVSLILATTFWFLTAYQADTLERGYSVPISFSNIPDEYLIEDVSPSEVFVTVSGRGENAFSEITEEDFTITFNVTELESGLNNEVLTNKNIVVPSDLSLVSFEPDSFLFNATKYVSTEVPVITNLTGELQDGLELKSVVVTPSTVKVLVAEEATVPKEIKTTEIDISGLKATDIVPAKLMLPEGVILESGGETASVAVTIEGEVEEVK